MVISDSNDAAQKASSNLAIIFFPELRHLVEHGGSLALLYDRVILPLVDGVLLLHGLGYFGDDEADHDDFDSSCLGSLVANTIFLREGSKPLSKPLGIGELLNTNDKHIEQYLSPEIVFDVEFRRFRTEMGIDAADDSDSDGWSKLSERDLPTAIDALRFFFATRAMRSHPKARVIHLVSAHSPTSMVLVKQIADVLSVESEQFCLPHVTLRPDEINAIRERVQNSNTRGAFRSKMEAIALRVASSWNQHSEDSRRDLLRSEIESLRQAWVKWRDELLELREKGYITLKESPSSNLLLTLQDKFVPTRAKIVARIPPLGGMEAEGTTTRSIAIEQEARRAANYVGPPVWQNHLLQIQYSQYSLALPEDWLRSRIRAALSDRITPQSQGQ